MSVTPTPRQRVRTFGLLYRLFWGSLGLKSKKTYSMAMVLDETDLIRANITGLKLKQQRAFPPVGKSLPWMPAGKAGITAHRAFLRKNPYSDLVLRITPYSSDEMAIANVLHAEELIHYDPTQHVVIHESHNLENLELPGLANVFAHEETMEGRKGTFKVLMAVSHVGSVLFVVQASSLGDFWTWDEVTSVTTLQADKIRRTMDVLIGIFD